MIHLLKNNYGFLFEDALLEAIAKVSTLKKIKANSTIIDVNNYIVFMPLVLNGAIKILREDKEGDELVLYYLEVGDTCAMTLSCCMGQTKSKIKAVAETDVDLLLIPKQKMTEWLSNYKSWQEFVLESYHNRLQEFLEAIDTIAFLNMDKRILKYLRDKVYFPTENDSNNENRIRIVGGKWDNFRKKTDIDLIFNDNGTTNVLDLFGEPMSSKTYTGLKKKITKAPNNVNYSSDTQIIEIFAIFKEPLPTKQNTLTVPKFNRKQRLFCC